jgi:alpha-N-arabinofuranosidase
LAVALNCRRRNGGILWRVGITAKSAKAETLTGTAADSINTFESPNAIVPKPTAVKIQNGRLSLTVAPRSATVVSIEP